MILSMPNILFQSRTDHILVIGLRLCALLVAGVVLLVFLFLLSESLPILTQVSISRFFTDPSWHPTQALYNITPMLSATVLSTLGALLLATPLGIASALFSRYYAPKILALWYRRLIELLAGIPSVVYGFWGLTTLAPLVTLIHPPGVSLFTAILILALMILPTIALTVDAAFISVPAAYYSGGAALGLSRWCIIKQLVLPTAQSGIASGVMLGAGRAIGETMAVLMVAGNVVQYPHSIFDSVRTLTANIALETAYAMGEHRAALFVSGLVLMLMVLGLVSLAEFFKRKSAYV